MLHLVCIVHPDARATGIRTRLTLSPGYKSSVLRSPSRPLIPLKRKTEGPPRARSTARKISANWINDLTRNAARNGAPLGERIIVTGRVMDERGRPVRNTLVEIWQANAAGRYVHKADQHDAPLDPNFLGAGRCMTDNDGRYRFLTIKPGAYPWGNHIRTHGVRTTSIFRSSANISAHGSSRRCTSRATRCSRSTRSSRARRNTRATGWSRDFPSIRPQEAYALGYEFDIVLRGPNQTPTEA